MESLFSLEVIVNFLKLEASKPNASPCLLPTVAFRLLDYPIIAISLVEKFDAEQLKSRLELTHPFERIEMLPCFTQLLDANGRYIFNKGKSCLFRADVNMLRGHLKNTPMYLMVLDTFYEPYKLLGTLAVPLNELIEEIYEEMSADGNDDSVDPLPSIKMSHGVCDVRNLMGNVIGHVSFVCRLTSFGKSIIPHLIGGSNKQPISTSKDNRKQQRAELKPQKQIEDPDTGELSVIYDDMRKKREERSVNTEPANNENAIVKTTPIDYKETRIEISDYANSNKIDKSTQSPQRQRKLQDGKKKTDGGLVIRQVADENFFGEYRPPPLFFNSQLDNSKRVDSNQLVSDIKNKQSFIDVRMAYLNDALKNQDYLEYENEPELATSEYDGDQSEMVFRAEKQQVQAQNKPIINLDQMPILKNLFDEITQLKSMIQGNHQLGTTIVKSPKTVERKPSSTAPVGILLKKKRPNLPTINKPTRTQQLRRERINETVNRLSQPKASRSQHIKPPTSGRESVESSNYRAWWDEKKDKPVPKPRQKKEPLKYGLTNTVKKRIEASRGGRGVENVENGENKIRIEDAQSLAEEVRKNLDKLNLTSNVEDVDTAAAAGNTDDLDAIYQAVVGASNDQLSEVVRRTMEQMLHLESTGSMMTNTSVQNSNNQAPANLNLNKSGATLNQTGHNQSTGNLSTMLLNRVDMDSTIDTMNYQQFLNNTATVAAANNTDQLNQTPTTTTKMVQFGGTHVFSRDSSSQSPDEQQHSSSETTSSSRYKNRKKKDDESSESSSSKTTSSTSALGRNIFLKNSKKTAAATDDLETTTSNNLSESNNNNNNKKYEDDFNSSFDSSSTHLMGALSPRKSPRTNNTKYSNDFFDFDNYDDYKGADDDDDD